MAGPLPQAQAQVADRVLRLALDGLGGGEAGRLLAAFAGPWRARLEALTPMPVADPGLVRSVLLRQHAAEARPDPDRVHPSWWVRALKDESPAVRRAVAARAEDPRVREAVRKAFGLSDADLEPDHPPDPEATRQALAIWAERLVGGPPRRSDDPPAVVALSALGPHRLYRLTRAAGLAKRAIVAEAPDASGARPEGLPALGAGDTAWVVQLAAAEAPTFDARFVGLARRDLKAVSGPGRRASARLGLITLGRLLSAAEPYRARWALQQVPYDVAKFLRSQMGPPTPLPRVVLEGEARILKLAADRVGMPIDATSPGGSPS